MIEILYEDNHLLVVVKPANMAVNSDSSNDLDLLTYLKQYLKEKYHKPNNVYLGLVHRLDRPVAGIMVFAKTSKAAARLSRDMQNNLFKKEYLAVICGNCDDKGQLTDYLTKDHKTNMVAVTDAQNGKLASLEYEKLQQFNQLTLVKILLHTGRSHQIRVQFASRNMPLWGDQRYNKNAKVAQQIALFAYRLSFPHPTTKQLMTFEVLPEKIKPFNLFNIAR
ncbi:MAG: RluA family pseudouridine synthase [Erysipelotrichaceae bacterium]